MAMRRNETKMSCRTRPPVSFTRQRSTSFDNTIEHQPNAQVVQFYYRSRNTSNTSIDSLDQSVPEFDVSSESTSPVSLVFPMTKSSPRNLEGSSTNGMSKK